MLKRSLHVGLNYPGTAAELSGCVNDALDWFDLCGSLGYSTTLMTEPTLVDIAHGIREGLAGLRWGDRFVFTYSGHGSWIPDLDGDEADGRDEVLCPSDYQRNVLTDDELFTLLDPGWLGVRRTVISDSCHSGTVHRFADVVPAIDGGHHARPRYLPPSTFLSARQIKRAEVVESNTLRSPSRHGAVLLSGCDDTEYSYDAWFGGRPNGAFTKAAISTHRSDRNMADWHQEIRVILPNAAYPQSPQLQALPWRRRWTL